MRSAAILGLVAALSAVASPPAAADKNAFFRALDDKPRAEFADLVVVTHILAHNAHQDKPFDQMRAELVVEGYLPEDWNYRPDSPVTKGMIAYGICSGLSHAGDGEYGVNGGLSMKVFGNNERYALRECVYLGILMEGHKNRYVTGEELLGILARAQKYRKTGKARTLQLEEEEEEEADAAKAQQQEPPKKEEK